jgi:cytochrome P450
MYELIGEFFTFLAAGTDTTSNTVNLALHNLHLRPDLVEKILN